MQLPIIKNQRLPSRSDRRPTKTKATACVKFHCDNSKPKPRGPYAISVQTHDHGSPHVVWIGSDIVVDDAEDVCRQDEAEIATNLAQTKSQDGADEVETAIVSWWKVVNCASKGLDCDLSIVNLAELCRDINISLWRDRLDILDVV